MGLAELPRYVPNALEVKASYPSALTIFNAASIISAYVKMIIEALINDKFFFAIALFFEERYGILGLIN